MAVSYNSNVVIFLKNCLFVHLCSCCFRKLEFVSNYYYYYWDRDDHHKSLKNFHSLFLRMHCWKRCVVIPLLKMLSHLYQAQRCKELLMTIYIFFFAIKKYHLLEVNCGMLNCSCTFSKAHYCPHFFCDQGCPSIIQKHLRKKKLMSRLGHFIGQWALARSGWKIRCHVAKGQGGFLRKNASAAISASLWSHGIYFF